MTCSGCRVDVFSDELDQGRVYEGSTVADAAGLFEFSSTTPITRALRHVHDHRSRRQHLAVLRPGGP